jgi:hypothetical protein
MSHGPSDEDRAIAPPTGDYLLDHVDRVAATGERVVPPPVRVTVGAHGRLDVRGCVRRRLAG